MLMNSEPGNPFVFVMIALFVEYTAHDVRKKYDQDTIINICTTRLFLSDFNKIEHVFSDEIFFFKRIFSADMKKVQ